MNRDATSTCAHHPSTFITACGFVRTKNAYLDSRSKRNTLLFEYTELNTCPPSQYISPNDIYLHAPLDPEFEQFIGPETFMPSMYLMIDERLLDGAPFLNRKRGGPMIETRAGRGYFKTEHDTLTQEWMESKLDQSRRELLEIVSLSPE